MHRDRSPSPSADALHAERASATDARLKVEGSTTTARRTIVIRSLLGRTGAGHRLQVDSEHRLGKASLVGDRWHPGDERSASIVERLAGLPITIGTIRHRLLDRAFSVFLGGFDHGERLVMVGAIAWQHGGCGD